MIIDTDASLDIFVGTKIGSFKHIKYHSDSSKNNKKCIKNLIDIKSLEKGETMTCMEWGNAEQTEILMGKKNQQVLSYSTLDSTFTSFTAKAEGPVVGVGRCGDRVLAALGGGAVVTWPGDNVQQTGGQLSTMVVCEDETSIYATGGDENDLKIWRVGESSPMFTAKNLPHDALQLRRPVWVSGVALLPGNAGRLAAVCSRHGYVRLYDSRAQRRPVVNVEFPNMAATCIANGFQDRQVLVGFARGQLVSLELRGLQPRRGYSGCGGAVSALRAARGLLASTSRDRHLRVHRADTKELLYQQYLTSQLTCLLVQTARSTAMASDVTEPDIIAQRETENDMDELFQSMQPVGEAESRVSQRARPSPAGSTATAADEESIRRLLKSTERLKRKRDKLKREKRAKSLYHNA